MNPLYTLLRTALFLLSSSAWAGGDADLGAALYKSRCAVCHSMDYNGAGPAHRGVFGREAAQVKGFSYSDALKGSQLKWNEESLDRWLANPEKLVPGQRMGVNVPDAKDRSDLIAYLQKTSSAPK